MMEPTYRQALSHAWKLTWHHKLIWVLGLLSVFLGQFGLSNFLGQFITKAITDEAWWPVSWGAIYITNNWQLFWLIWTMILIAAILLFILVAAVCAQGALIYTAIHWYHTRTLFPISKAWRKATKHFWGILGINILEKFSLSVILAVVLMIMDNLSGATTLGFAVQIILVAFSLFLALVISATAIYALGYTVMDSVPVVEAVGRGWRLLEKHLLVSLELSAILLLCNFIVMAAISLASFIVLIPSFFVTLVAGVTGYTNLLAVSVALYLFLFIAFIMIIGAIFNAFTTSAWMYLFMKMHHEGVASRLGHWIGKAFIRKS